MTPPLATVTAADIFGLVVSALVCVYLVYALLRGEKL
jgi:K+-transporting ATPase KdpF subunit